MWSSPQYAVQVTRIKWEKGKERGQELESSVSWTAYDAELNSLLACETHVLTNQVNSYRVEGRKSYFSEVFWPFYPITRDTCFSETIIPRTKVTSRWKVFESFLLSLPLFSLLRLNLTNLQRAGQYFPLLSLNHFNFLTVCAFLLSIINLSWLFTQR